MNIIDETIVINSDDLFIDRLKKNVSSNNYLIRRLGVEYDDQFEEEDAINKMIESFFLKGNVFQERNLFLFIIETVWMPPLNTNNYIIRKRIVEEFAAIGSNVLVKQVFVKDNMSRFSAILNFDKHALSKTYTDTNYKTAILSFIQNNDIQIESLNKSLFEIVADEGTSLNWVPAIDYILQQNGSICFLTGGADFRGFYLDIFLKPF